MVTHQPRGHLVIVRGLLLVLKIPCVRALMLCLGIGLSNVSLTALTLLYCPLYFKSRLAVASQGSSLKPQVLSLSIR